MRITRAKSGFTLVEMMVAMALLGLLGIISWRGLDYVVGQRERIDRDAEEIGRVLRVLAQIERDIAQRAPDVVLPAATATAMLPAAIAVSVADIDRTALEIVRIAPSAGGPALAMRVAYRIADGALIRTTSAAAIAWPVPAASNTVVLLPGARRLGVRVYAGGAWVDMGADLRAQSSAPASGLEISIDDSEGARYVRVLAL
jgi:general secretion pathway protein J